MSEDLIGLTECPKCESELEYVDGDDERPIQHLQQRCSSPICAYLVHQALLWYTPARYIVVAPEPLERECNRDDCLSTAIVIAQETGDPTTRRRCDGHVKAHVRTALEVCESHRIR